MRWDCVALQHPFVDAVQGLIEMIDMEFSILKSLLSHFRSTLPLHLPWTEEHGIELL